MPPWAEKASAWSGLSALAMSLLCISAAAQPPAIGIAPVTLTESSYTFDTAEQHGIRVVVVAKGLKHPFAVALLPSGDALVSERGGPLRWVHHAGGTAGNSPSLDPVAIAGLPAAPDYRNGGLQDVALHPLFAQNHLVYFTFNQAGDLPPEDAKPPIRHESRVALMRGRLEGNGLTHVERLFIGGSGTTSGSRLAFDGHGMIYMTTGGPFDDSAQRLDTIYGKVLRLRDDGTIRPTIPSSDAPAHAARFFPSAIAITSDSRSVPPASC